MDFEATKPKKVVSTIKNIVKDEEEHSNELKKEKLEETRPLNM